MKVQVKVLKLGDRKDLVLRWIDPELGAMRQKTSGTTDRKAAEEAAEKLADELDNPEPEFVSWDEFRERFMEERAAGLAWRTGVAYSVTFNLLEECCQPATIKDVTTGMLSQFQAALRKRGLREITIAKYLRHMRGALRWAKELDLIERIPVVQMPRRAKQSKVMKGRPLTEVEFARLRDAAESVVGAQHAAAWRFFIEGLWWSGLRVGEALDLYWDRPDRLYVDLGGRFPMFRIRAEFEKGNKDRILPMAPEFAEFLRRIPESERVGAVFKLTGFGNPSEMWRSNNVSKIGSRIGRQSGVVVDIDPRTSEPSFASLHDLRRAFGVRWAQRVLPQDLKELMRHEAIETMLRFYVGQDAERTASTIWAAVRDSNMNQRG